MSRSDGLSAHTTYRTYLSKNMAQGRNDRLEPRSCCNIFHYRWRSTCSLEPLEERLRSGAGLRYHESWLFRDNKHQPQIYSKVV